MPRPDAFEIWFSKSALTLAVQKRYSNCLPSPPSQVNFALRRGGRVLLADEMGLGKTAQAACISQIPAVARHVVTLSVLMVPLLLLLVTHLARDGYCKS